VFPLKKMLVLVHVLLVIRKEPANAEFLEDNLFLLPKTLYQLTITPLNKFSDGTPPQHPNVTSPHITPDIRALHTHNPTIRQTPHKNSFILIRFINHTHATGGIIQSL
jgi:hypothetical protein